MSYDFFAQAVGLVASFFIVSALVYKNDVNLKISLFVGAMLFAIHFYMLAAYVGMFIVFVGGIRNILSIKFYKSNKLMWSFITVYLSSLFWNVEDAADLLPVFSGVLGTYALYQFSGIKLRCCMSVSSLSWLIYDIVYKSIGGIVTEALVQFMNIITITRLLKDKKKNEQST